MKKLLILIAVISLSFSAYAQEQNSESMKKVVVARLSIKSDKADQFLQAAEKLLKRPGKKQDAKFTHSIRVVSGLKMNSYSMKNTRIRKLWTSITTHHIWRNFSRQLHHCLTGPGG